MLLEQDINIQDSRTSRVQWNSTQYFDGEAVWKESANFSEIAGTEMAIRERKILYFAEDNKGPRWS